MSWRDTYKKWLDNKNIESDLKLDILKLDDNQKEECFSKYIDFGTAGMRGIIGPGTNRINKYTIRKACYGFGKYILSKFANEKNITISIGYDTRFFSREFAEECAKVLAFLKIKTYLFDKPRPTPMLSFLVRQNKSAGGIMITASHNPKNYNGFKIYDSNGCQFLPDENNKIIQFINEYDGELDLQLKDNNFYIKQGFINIAGKEILDTYVSLVTKLYSYKYKNNKVSVIYSSLNGTGYSVIKKVFNTLGYLDITYVHHQCIEDPNFTTCSTPNPEDKESFKESIKIADDIKADIIFVTDLDADRVGVAVRYNNKYTFLNGNEIGNILAYYIVSNWQVNKKISTLVNTIVTNDLCVEIANDFNIRWEKTLIGFKYIGDLIDKYETNTKKEFLFGFEESFGSLINSDISRDKDAIQSIVLLFEIAQMCKQNNITLLDYLNSIYKKYSYYSDNLININLDSFTGKGKINKLLAKLRETPILKIAGLDVIEIEDYLKSQTLILPTYKVKDIFLPKENILKFKMEDKSWIVLRASGTEPKLKIYISTKASTQDQSEYKNKVICKEISSLVNDLLSDQITSKSTN